MKAIFYANTNQKVSVLELIADKIDTNARSNAGNKEDRYTVIKILVHWENTATLYMCNT